MIRFVAVSSASRVEASARFWTSTRFAAAARCASCVASAPRSCSFAFNKARKRLPDRNDAAACAAARARHVRLLGRQRVRVPPRNFLRGIGRDGRVPRGIDFLGGAIRGGGALAGLSRLLRRRVGPDGLEVALGAVPRGLGRV